MAFLKPNESLEADFMLTDDEVVAVYAYCNLYSMWKNQENWK